MLNILPAIIQLSIVMMHQHITTKMCIHTQA